MWLLVVNYFLYQSFRAPILNCIDNIIITDCIKNNYDYGKIRVYASLSWGLSLFIFLPVVDIFGYTGFFITGVLFAVICCILVINISVPKSEQQFSNKKKFLLHKDFLNYLGFGILFGSVVAINPSYQSLLLIEMDSNQFVLSLGMFLSTFLMLFSMPLSSKLESRLSSKKY